MNDYDTKELRLKRGSHILEYIKRFSATEKAIFGVLVLVTLFTSLTMTVMASDKFKVEIPSHGGIFREGVVGLPRTINPVLAITDVDHDLSRLVYSGLMKYQDGEIVPDIAQNFTVSDDGLTYTFKIRSDVKFQDGTKLTTDDIAFTIQKIQNAVLKSPRRSDWVNVTVNVVSPSEINFVLKQPYSPFLTNTTIGILPKHIWGLVSDEQFIFSQYNIEPIGTGPYKVANIVRDSGGIPTEYNLTTWSGYYDEQPFVKNIRFNFFADEEKALSSLDAGNIDSLAAVPSTVAANLANDKAQAYTVISSPLPRVFGLFMNQSHAPVLADKVVRQALDMSVDREDIIEKVLSGYGHPITGPLPAGLGNLEFDGEHLDQEIADAMSTQMSLKVSTTTKEKDGITLAKELLEKNGWKKGADGVYSKKKTSTASTTLAFDIYTVDSPDLKLAAELVKEYWSELGASVNIKIFESSDLYQNIIRPRKFDVLLFGEQIGKDRDLYAFWHSSQRNAPGLNVTMYTNSKVDKVLENIRTTNDPHERQDGYSELDELIREDIPAVFLYSPDFTYVVPKKIKGIDLRSVTVPSDRWNSINDWYINTEKVWKIFTK